MIDEYNWLKPRAKKLVEIAEPLKTIHPTVFYETGEWSIIKLLALLRFVDIYTKIIKAPRRNVIILLTSIFSLKKTLRKQRL